MSTVCPKINFPALFLALFWSVVIMLVVPVRFASDANNYNFKYILVFLFLFMSLAVGIRLAGNFQVSVKPYPDSRSCQWWMIGSTALCAIIWSIYGWFFYPGLISWDFYVQWYEMSGKIPFSDWHPLFHTLFIWLVTRIWYSPAMVSLVQIMTLSLLVGLLAKRLYRLGTPWWVVLFLVAFYAFFPLNGFYAVSLWKDIGYSIAFLWLNILVLDIVVSKGKVLTRKSTLLSLFLSLWCVAMMRHNGIVPALGSLLILFLVYYRKYLKPLFLVLISLVAMIVIFKGPVFTWLNVDVKSKNVLKAHLPIQHVGAVLNAGREISLQDKEFLTQIMPLSYWKQAYDSRSCMPLIFGKKTDGSHYLNGEFLKDNERYREFLGIWAKLVLKNFDVIIRYHLTGSELLWRIQTPYRSFVIADEDLVEEDLYSGYKPSLRLSERVGDAGRYLIQLINDPATGWLLHRGALYFWLSLFFLSLTIVRTRQWTVVIVAVPMLLQMSTVAAFPLVQDTRFMYPIILVAPMLMALFFSWPAQSRVTGRSVNYQ